MRWTAEENGECEIRILGEGNDSWGCEYNTDSGVFGILDESCGMTYGEYYYSIKDDILWFELIEDKCRDRAEGLEGEWTRVE